MKRRQFLAGASAGVITTLDWLTYFKSYGVPGGRRSLGIAEAAAAAATAPHYLIYWFQEGGWDGYSMFNPVNTPNDATGSYSGLNPSPSWSNQVYRPSGWGTAPNDLPKTAGNLNYGFLAANGASLFNDLAIVSSHQGNQFHSGGRWDYHYGKYDKYAALTNMRGPDERTVMQAFCEAYGSSYLLPHLSWHRWMADGELSLTDYPVGTGYFENLGPNWAHTIYGKTPADMRTRLQQIQSLTSNARDNRIRKFTDSLDASFLKDKNSASTQAFASAVQIHNSLVGAGSVDVDPTKMFTDAALRTAFSVTSEDESASATSVNGNPARSKESPNTNVQALMTYEMMTKGLSIGFFLESRSIRGFDSHRGRSGVLSNHGQTNQLSNMNSNLWAPLNVLVSKLKATPHPVTGKSYFDHTTIVLASEMGRMMSADAADIIAGSVTGVTTDDQKSAAIQDQDVCQHWFVSSVAFLGGTVQGNRQYGKTVWPLQKIPNGTGGTRTVGAIPMMPDGTLDPAFNSTTGAILSGKTQNPGSYISDAGHVYSTALALSGLDPDALRTAGKGRNNRPVMSFIKKV